MANFQEYTRYTGGQVATDREGRQFLVLRQPLGLQQQSDDVFIVITQNYIGRPDLISYTAYNQPDLWWVIFEYNNIYDPLFDLQIGQTIRIPELNRVLAAISALNPT